MDGSNTPVATGTRDIADQDSVLTELNAAIAADQNLRASTPQSEAEWEDLDHILAENLELAALVPLKIKQSYSSQTKWECGHESKPVGTDIEADVPLGAQSTTTGDSGGGWERSMLVDDVKGICPDCMEQWKKYEAGYGSNIGEGSSHEIVADPPLCTYTHIQSDDELYSSDEGSDTDRLDVHFNQLGIDEDPEKGEVHVDAASNFGFKLPRTYSPEMLDDGPTKQTS